MKKKAELTSVGLRLGGRAKARVIGADGQVRTETPWKKNLVMNDGLADIVNAVNFLSLVNTCRAGTGTSATKAALDGTFAQTGTTVTRSTGTGTFSAGDVGKHIKFGTGEERRITSFSSSTEVEVRESGTVSATSLELYETETTALDAQVKFSSTLDGGAGANETSVNTSENSIYFKRTYNFAVEVSTVNYNEIGISRASASDLFARIVLDSTVTVNSGEQLQIVYELTVTCPTWLTSTPITPVVSGWPYPYEATSIVHGGASFDVTFTEDHHYLAGDEITISNAVPTEVAISSISSDPSEFTVTTSGVHGLSVSDSIEIEGASPSGYNGTWTVAAVDSTTVFRVTSGINPGAGSGGTVRLSTPTPYFNGTWTIASVPTSDSIRITDATISTGFDASNGDIVGSLAGDVRVWGSGDEIFFTLSNTKYQIAEYAAAALIRCSLWRDGSEITSLGLGQGGFLTGAAATATRSSSRSAYDPVDQSWTRYREFDIDEGNFDDIKQIGFQGGPGSSASAFLITFDQNQRKEAGYSLGFGYKVTLRQDLP